MKSSSAVVRVSLAAALIALGGCQNLPNVSPGTGALIGAGTGAVSGAVIGDGGVIAPAIGAVAGAVVGKEVAERDPLFD